MENIFFGRIFFKLSINTSGVISCTYIFGVANTFYKIRVPLESKLRLCQKLMFIHTFLILKTKCIIYL